MNEEGYSFTKEPNIIYYEFFSEGPNGKIRKVVHFKQVSAKEEIYNLGFGDFNPDADDVDDLSVSNNLDTQKILATVAKTVVDFMQLHPRSVIVAKGS